MNYFTYNKVQKNKESKGKESKGKESKNKESKSKENNNNIITEEIYCWKSQNNYNYILSELSEQSIIKYIYMKDNSSGLLMIKYTELNFVPLYETIRNHPLSHGYGDFEIEIISIYNDMIKRKNIINLLSISKHWDIPKEISIYICKIFWTLIN